MSSPSSGISQIASAITMACTGAPLETINFELHHAIREFCVRSTAWMYFFEVNLEDDVTDYNIEPDDNRAQISSILSVTIDGRMVSGWSGVTRSPDTSPISGDFSINPDELLESTINTLRLARPVKGNQKMVVTEALRPRGPGPYLPDYLCLEFFDTIVAGALARLHQHQGRPYVSREHGYRCQKEFKAGMTRARDKVRSQLAQLTIPWVYPQVATGRRF